MAFVIQEHEQPMLEEFREIMKGEVSDDRTLIRFLRARDGNIKKAEEMLRKSLDWRNTNNIDGIKMESIQAVSQELRIFYCGQDDDKHPIYMIPIGSWDGRKILGKFTKDDTCRYMYKMLETIMKQCSELGVFQFRAILDFTGLTFWKVAHYASIENVIRVTLDFEANYPETLYSLHCINAPSVFWQAFKAVKPLLAKNTLDKIRIFDGDKTKWVADLLDQIPKESLPVEIGGLGRRCSMWTAIHTRTHA